MQDFNVQIQEPLIIGMNDRLPSHELPQGVYSLLDNVLIADNKIVKRPGNTASNSVQTTTDILGGTAFEPNGGTKVQIICVNGASNSQLYISTDGITFITLGPATLAANAQMNFVQASNILLGFNGTDEIDYDGAALTIDTAGIPIGKFAYWFHNYLFVAGVTGFPNRLYWSNLGDPRDFSSPNTTGTGSGFVDINANDGDFITGLSEFNDELLVFKQYSVHAISGFSGSSFTSATSAGQNTTTTAIGYGTPSHRSIVGAGAYLYWLSFTGGVPHIRRFERTLYGIVRDAGIVSFELEGTMKTLNFSALSKAAGIFDGKYIYWALPTGSSTSNNTVIVNYADKTFQTKFGPMFSWTKWSSGLRPANFFVSTISGIPKVYWTGGGTSGRVFVFDSSVFVDNTTPIVSEVRTRDMMGDPAKKTKWKYMYLKYDTSSAGTLNVNARIDQSVSFTSQGQDITLTGNSPGLGPTGTFTLGVSTLGGSMTNKKRITLEHLVGTMLGVQMREATAHGLTLYDFEYYGNKKGLRAD